MRTWGNDDSVDANDDCVVCSSSSSSRMSKWRRKPLSRLSGSRACRANPCVHATYYTVYNLPHCNSNTIYPPNRRHSPIVCTINYPNITLANICLASLSLANTAILFRLLSLSLSCSLSLSSHNLKVFLPSRCTTGEKPSVDSALSWLVRVTCLQTCPSCLRAKHSNDRPKIISTISGLPVYNTQAFSVGVQKSVCKDLPHALYLFFLPRLILPESFLLQNFPS